MHIRMLSELGSVYFCLWRRSWYDLDAFLAIYNDQLPITCLDAETLQTLLTPKIWPLVTELHERFGRAAWMKKAVLLLQHLSLIPLASCYSMMPV